MPNPNEEEQLTLQGRDPDEASVETALDEAEEETGDVPIPPTGAGPGAAPAVADDETAEDAGAEGDTYPPGESASVSPTAPPSSGELTGEDGEIVTGDGPDLRPANTRGGPRERPDGETPVDEPSTGGGTSSASAGAAGVAAGSGGPAEPPADDALDADEDDEEG